LSIDKYSASSLQLYDKCAKKFYYNYIEKLPRKTWDHNALGHVAHSALEFFHKDYDGTQVLKELMAQSFKKALKENKKECHDVDFFAVKKGKDVSDAMVAKNVLQDYLDKMRREGMPEGVVAIEKDFNFRLDGKYLLRGMIDRIDKVDGRYTIYDYKTSKSTKYMNDFQLSLYALWFFEAKASENIDEVDAGYIMLRHKSIIIPYHFTKEGLESRKQEIFERCESILAEEKWPKNPTILCNWCDFHEDEGGPCSGRRNEETWTV